MYSQKKRRKPEELARYGHVRVVDFTFSRNDYLRIAEHSPATGMAHPIHPFRLGFSITGFFAEAGV
jgi:hypothetical protein